MPAFAESFDFSGCRACCFTGHRPEGLPQKEADTALLRLKLIMTVQQAVAAGADVFYAGGARGFDMLAAEAVLFLREQERLPLKLKLALPSRRQADAWPQDDRRRYYSILDKADETYYASDRNDAAAMHARNRYLVDHADCCIAYLRKLSGGTHYTVRYAERRGVPVCNLAEYLPGPKQLSILA